MVWVWVWVESFEVVSSWSLDLFCVGHSWVRRLRRADVDLLGLGGGCFCFGSPTFELELESELESEDDDESSCGPGCCDSFFDCGCVLCVFGSSGCLLFASGWGVG